MTEVPPDGIIEISFSADVDPELVGAALKLATSKGKLSTKESKGFAVSSCAGGGWYGPRKNCVSVDISTELETDTQYQLVLPSGSRYL